MDAIDYILIGFCSGIGSSVANYLVLEHFIKGIRKLKRQYHGHKRHD